MLRNNVIAALLLVWAVQVVAAEDRSAEARQYLAEAVHTYRAGKPDRAAFLLKLAKNIDGPAIASAFDGRKLEAFLALRGGDNRLARRELEAALSIQDDGFLAYLAGQLALESGDLDGARRNYAQTSGGPSASNDDAGLELFLSPLACLAKVTSNERPDLSMLDSALAAPFADDERANEIWTRGITDVEARIALYTAHTIAIVHNDEASSEVTGAISADDPLLERLISNPGNEAASRDCIVSVEKTRTILLKQIEEGYTHSANRRLVYVQRLLRRLYLFHTIRFDSIAQRLRFANFLTESDGNQSREALYNLRVAYARINHAEIPGAGTEELHAAARILDLMAISYREMQSEEDAYTTRAMAVEIHRFLSQETDRLEFREALLNRARSNYTNREALQLLVANAREENDLEKVREFQTRIDERDEITALSELQAAFRY